MKVMVVFGTRPEAIKMAPVVHALKARGRWIDVVTCVTAQHREMLDQVLELFGIAVDYDLDVMTIGQDLYDVTTRVIGGMREILQSERPDVVLVHGDTTTSMAAAISAFYERIPVGHVEAGLRSKKRYSPFPEEMNRRLTAQLATWHYCPTRNSRANLRNEGVDSDRIFMTGNTAIDALLWMKQNLKEDSTENVVSPGRRLILVTAHRRENFGAGIENICCALMEIVARYPDIEIVYPVHPNPNIKDTVTRILGGVERTRLIDPVDYRDFVVLMSSAYLILTDSGGVQEEAPSLGKPVLVLRDCTERPEAVDAGTVQLIGTDRETIVTAASKLLDDSADHERMAKAVNPYGDGAAAQRIADHLVQTLVADSGESQKIEWFRPDEAS